LHPSSSGSTAPLPPPNHMLGIFQPGKMKSFQFELPSVTAAQQESTRHQSSSAQTMLSRAQSNSMAPNDLPSLPNDANPYPCHGPVQSSLDKHVNSYPNEIIHKQVKHDTKDSLINPFQSNCLSVTSVQQESTSHQSSSAPTMSSSIQLVSNALYLFRILKLITPAMDLFSHLLTMSSILILMKSYTSKSNMTQRIHLSIRFSSTVFL
jgi:hypothetical protein